eukprot:SM012180S25881  [mRNA]  locus=s12180:63:381:- [translate_table: standard]
MAAAQERGQEGGGGGGGPAAREAAGAAHMGAVQLPSRRCCRYGADGSGSRRRVPA